MRLLLTIVLVVVLGWAALAAVAFALHHGDEPVHADAVVVLEGSKTRLPLGLKLVREGYAPLLVVSLGDRKTLEARLCSGRERVPHVRVICFSAIPLSTRGEAEYIGRLAEKERLYSIDVVTSKFHVLRAGILIRRCYHGRLHVVGAPESTWRLPLYLASETAKLAYQETVARKC
jgi:uncharacterized SAM-binding protein YcdF (DUF218 family)